jgi:hypothetical protein
MNSPPDDFGALRKLLALKRYEQPPPGYFQDFPDRVLARLDANEAEAGPGWWAALLAAFELRPALAGVLGLAVLALCGLGLNLAQKAEHKPAQRISAVVERWHPPAPAPNVLFRADFRHAPAGSSLPPAFASSMDPVTGSGPPPGLFAPGAGLRLNEVRPVSFRLGGN